MTMIDVTMPRLSDQMEEGVILSWLASDGDEIDVGQELLEIETDKATMTCEAEVAGILQIVAAEGTSVPVGEIIARIGAEAEPASSATPSPHAQAQDTLDARAQSIPERPPIPAAASRPSPSANGDARLGDRPAATPLARRVARVHGVELDAVAGTGPDGRITKADVLTTAGIQAPAKPASPMPSEPTPALPSRAPATPAPCARRLDTAKGEPTIQALTRLQATVARRMAQAKATVPHFQVQTEARMDAAIALRAQLKELADGGPVPSFNDIIVRACGLALRDHPLVNGSFEDHHYELHERINIGIAVASDAGLVVATIPDADQKSLGDIGRSARNLAQRVRCGEITPPELAGGTFTVSNLGMFGMTAITPVINPPQAAILGVGAMRDSLARENGEIVDRKLLTLTLSCDHRILNGADASRFLSQVKDLLETPMRLAL
jgi:pyruvate dehydrogenase E2 component (dihydrolipoyllysine-residue acetyltransferase)